MMRNLINLDVNSAVIYVALVISVVMAGGGGLWAAYKRAVVPIQQTVQMIRTACARTETMWKAWQPNGGMSLADKFGRMESAIMRLTAITWADHEQSPDPRVEFVNGSHMHIANPRALAAFGMDMKTAAGHGWLNALPTIQRAAVAEQMTIAASECRQVKIHIVIQRTQSDGDSMMLSLYPITEAVGGKVGFLGYLTPMEGARA
jgi:hypothetical protein